MELVVAYPLHLIIEVSAVLELQPLLPDGPASLRLNHHLTRPKELCVGSRAMLGETLKLYLELTLQGLQAHCLTAIYSM